MAEQYDVIVVGAGNAALTAAISAAEKGAQVAVLEKATREERGGNTRFTGGAFRTAHSGKSDVMRLVDDIPKEEWDNIEIEAFPSDVAYQEIMRVTQNKADPKLTRITVDRSYDTVLWMKEKVGVQWTLNNIFQPADFGVKKYRGGGVLKAKDQGIGLSNYLFAKAESLPNVTVLYEAKATKLLSESDTVTGVKATVKGSVKDVRAKTVVLGSGGFEASPELRAKYMGKAWTGTKVRGTRYNTGEMLTAALEVGAQPAGDWSDCHASPIDGRSPAYGDLKLRDSTARYSWMYGVLFNKSAKRFVDEGQDYGDLVYARLGKLILQQPDAAAHQIFDQKVVHLLEKRYQTMPPITASSIEELGKKIGVDPTRLQEEIEKLNASVKTSVPFDPSTKDRRTTDGIQPPKSNWAQRIDSPPYIAYPVTCGITFTFGGIRIDEKAHVLNKHSKPITGLYATGEITGSFFYHNYPGGGGLVRGAVYGRIAGLEAANQAGC